MKRFEKFNVTFNRNLWDRDRWHRTIKEKILWPNKMAEWRSWIGESMEDLNIWGICTFVMPIVLISIILLTMIVASILDGVDKLIKRIKKY